MRCLKIRNISESDSDRNLNASFNITILEKKVEKKVQRGSKGPISTKPYDGCLTRELFFGLPNHHSNFEADSLASGTQAGLRDVQ